MKSEERIMDRIQKLLDKAMSTEFEGEQDALLQKADALMMQYSIEQIQMDMREKTAPTIKGQEPEFRDISVMTPQDTDEGFEMAGAMNSMFHTVASHYHTKATYKRGAEPGTVRVVGYPADLDFLEMLYLQLKLHMLTNLAPKVDPSKPWIEAVANLKNTGHKWAEIHYEMQSHPDYPRRNEPWSKSCGLTMYGRYKKFVEEVGADYVGTSSPKTWRSDFIAGYTSRINSRLREIRAQTVSGDDRLPALFVTKDDDVKEAYYQEYPDERPHPKECECAQCEARRKPMKMTGPGSRGGRGGFRYRNTGAMNAGGSVANRADLSTSGGRVSSAKKKEIR